MQKEKSGLRGFLFCLLLLLLVFFPARAVLAADNYLARLDIQVLINPDGSAHITELRQASLGKDTENFIIIGNLGRSTIHDFQVEEDGRVYTFLNNWDVQASREEKAFKNGLIKKDNHYELCWGIGDYGEHLYQVSYTVTDFIKQLDDAQVVYWRFVNDKTNLPPQQVNLTIAAKQGELPGTAADIWAFGFAGTIRRSAGEVAVSSEVALTDQDYVTVLVRLPQGSFQTKDVLPLSFDQVQKRAFRGSDYSDSPQKSTSSNYLVVAFVALMAVLPVFVVIKYARERRRLAGLKRQYAGRYWYKSPFQGEPAQIYALLKRDHKTTFERLMASYLMNWLIKGVIAPQKVKAQGILRREKTQIRLDQAYRPSGYLETELYTVFQLACADGFVTDQKQLARIIRLRSSQIQAWPARVEKDSQQFLFESGFIVEAAAKLELTWRGREFNGSLFMFANFLRDFAQRQSQLAQSENELDSLMGWAILFGLSDELQRHYQALFPGRYSSSMATGDALAWTRMLSNNLASASSSSSSSSSSGGGGGSFGGGSGGGTR